MQDPLSRITALKRPPLLVDAARHAPGKLHADLRGELPASGRRNPGSPASSPGSDVPSNYLHRNPAPLSYFNQGLFPRYEA